MVTKYHMEKSQPFMNSIKDIIKNPRKRKKRNKKTVNKKKERKKTYFKYMKNGGLNSKYNKMARKFRRRTRRKRGGGVCEDDYDCDDLDNETHTGKCVEDNDGNRVCTAITNNQGGRRRRKRGGEGRGWKVVKDIVLNRDFANIVNKVMTNPDVKKKLKAGIDEFQCEEILKMISEATNIKETIIELQNLVAEEDDRDAEILLSGLNRFQMGELTDKKEQKEVCDTLIKYLSPSGGKRRRRRKSTKKKRKRRRKKRTRRRRRKKR